MPEGTGHFVVLIRQFQVVQHIDHGFTVRWVPNCTSGTAPGWPLVVYFHRVETSIAHYTALPPGSFAAALELLARWFSPLDPRAVSNGAIVRDYQTPRCLITVDDGWRDGLFAAAPLLEERGWRAIFFVPTSTVGLAGRLTWDELADLRERGHVVASHGHEHLPFDELGGDALERDVRHSFALLRQRLGEAPALFAYPYGRVPVGAAKPAALRGVLDFGTVKTRARPWSLEGAPIRRTYLPTAREDVWPELVEGWHSEWCAVRSRL